MNSNVEGNRYRCKPRLGQMDGVKRALGEKGMSFEQGRQKVDRRRWELIKRSEQH